MLNPNHTDHVISCNQLRSLPDSFGSIVVGGGLWLDNNQLSSLPDSFGSITVDKGLGLSNNKLGALPLKTVENRRQAEPPRLLPERTRLARQIKAAAHVGERLDALVVIGRRQRRDHH